MHIGKIHDLVNGMYNIKHYQIFQSSLYTGPGCSGDTWQSMSISYSMIPRAGSVDGKVNSVNCFHGAFG